MNRCQNGKHQLVLPLDFAVAVMFKVTQVDGILEEQNNYVRLYQKGQILDQKVQIVLVNLKMWAKQNLRAP